MAENGDKDLRIVLLGKTGSGKSATGNTILGKKLFLATMSPESETKQCEKHEEMVDGRKISVIDTPGLFDTSMTENKLKSKIEQCVKLSLPGPHVFLLVIRVGRYTAEERSTVEWIQKNFGEEASKHTIVLFTHVDALETPVEEYIKQSKPLKDLVQRAEGGYHLFNNKDMEDRSQVQTLLKKIDVLVRKYYTNEMYKMAQEKLRQEEEERKEEEEQRRRELEERIRADEKKKFEREKQAIEEQLRRVKEANRRHEMSGRTMNRRKTHTSREHLIGAGIGLAVGTVAAVGILVAAVKVKVPLVAVAFPIALFVFPALGVGIGLLLKKTRQPRQGERRHLLG